MSAYPRVASFKTVDAFRARLAELGLAIESEDQILTAPESPLAQPLEVDGLTVGNRFVVHPMEGWDAESDGRPSELVRRRWRNFGRSGAKWIWGGEAMAVVPEGRANPNQLVINETTRDPLARLLEDTVAAHREDFGSTDDLLAGFQLTHSGRFCRPFRKDRAEPKILYHHPILDAKFGTTGHPLMMDDEIRRLVDRFIAAAQVAESCGAQFVDLKHCHGYLGHEFLSAHTRPGPYGGSLENRTRFLREIVEGVRGATRRLKIAVRLSAFDFIPFKPDPSRNRGRNLGPGIPEEGENGNYRFGFGVARGNPVEHDLSETIQFIGILEGLSIRMLNVTAGSPYYTPHIQRPALFPPSDGYQPPEDPLVGCARQIAVTAELKKRFPEITMVGTAYSYLQEYLPHVAQWGVRAGYADAVGIGRMVLSYPTLPRDVLQKGKLETKRICRTFSDCTTGPRNGLVSGCYPLDPFYRAIPDAAKLKAAKQAAGDG